MTGHSAFLIMCRVLGVTVGLGIASFLYTLWAVGLSATGFLFAMGLTLLICGLTVFGGVVMIWSNHLWKSRKVYTTISPTASRMP